MEKLELKCKVCGKKLNVSEVGGWDKGIDTDVYCDSCAIKTDTETNKDETNE